MQWMEVLIIAVVYYKLPTAFPKISSARNDIIGLVKGGSVIGRQFSFRHMIKMKQVTNGCMLDGGQFLQYGQTHRTAGFVFLCEKTKTGAVLTLTKCIINGTELAVGKDLSKEPFLYSCLDDEYQSDIYITGCSADKGGNAKFGEFFTAGSYFYRCDNLADMTVHNPISCIIVGTKVGVGTTVEIGNLWYTCVKTRRLGNHINIQVLACASKDGGWASAGKKYKDGQFLYQCKATETGLEIVFAGCLDYKSNGRHEFNFGESWLTRRLGLISYKKICTGNEDHAVTDVLECIFDWNRGRKVLRAGHCAKYGDDFIATCLKDAAGEARGNMIRIEHFAFWTKTGDIKCPRLDE
ncbi:hypothetical protein M513_11186 [Trichuris suis]|uniref:Abnormal cell migration protein 18-like fibronectin type I domain-containing protein n=1 Tax=Trichuris suis TaxID=68888 RepID=A0A085LSK7_9BILA|nr:hypothetical protein M513_11186 [Trichuris suis]